MVLPTEISIKKETEDLELDSAGYLSPSFEITVKVEEESSNVYQVQIKNEYDVSAENIDNINAVDYEELIQCAQLNCAVCDEEFYERYSLLRHNLDHLEVLLEPLYECPICSRCYPTEIEMLNHKSTHKKKPQFQCKICGKVETYKDSLLHMKEVHGYDTDEYECSVCSATFRSAKYLRKHFRRMHYKKKIITSQTNDNEKCDLCPAVLRSKKALKTHIKACHRKRQFQRAAHNKKEHRCNCGKKFQSQLYLKLHKQQEH